ncbi:hypothetical protein D7U36_07110 [Propionibacterium australiense]|uniref:Molybdopterin molybdenumtransferase n=2 Tax=Propionibacterium australiense TaxID=119981 RepID=A0A8B3FRY5_9ACTN|nr:hypothetical protein D7U36_07110 [Propionibacterium australiense]
MGDEFEGQPGAGPVVGPALRIGDGAARPPGCFADRPLPSGRIVPGRRAFVEGKPPRGASVRAELRHAHIVWTMALFGRSKKPVAVKPAEPEAKQLAPAPAPGPHGARTVEDQRDWICSMIEPLMPFGMNLIDASGLNLCEDLLADGDLPALPEAACDGYAVISVDVRDVDPRTGAVLTITSDVHAEASAVPVLVGHPMPPGADAVVPLDAADVIDGENLLVRCSVEAGANVRQVGSDAADGTVIAKAGTKLDARLLGLIGGAGFDKVLCRPRPRVVVLALREKGQLSQAFEVTARQHRDAASFMVASAARDAGAQVWREESAAQDAAAVAEVVTDQLIRADLLITVGGIERGADGLLAEALTGLGPIDFSTIALRPGPVQGFGLVGADRVPVLMLSSDPASAYTGYEVFGRPAIASLMGAEPERATTQVRLDAPVDGDRSVCEYVPAQVMSTPDGVHALPLTDRPGSLGQIARCDGFLVLGEGSLSAQAGDLVDYVALGGR